MELQGAVTRDPDVRAMPSGTLLVECSLAVSDARFNAESGQQEAVTTYVQCQFWDVLAKRIVDTGVGVGDELYLVGRLDQYEIEKSNGTKDRKTRVHVLHFNAARYSKRHQEPPDVTPPW